MTYNVDSTTCSKTSLKTVMSQYRINRIYTGKESYFLKNNTHFYEVKDSHPLYQEIQESGLARKLTSGKDAFMITFGKTKLCE